MTKDTAPTQWLSILDRLLLLWLIPKEGNMVELMMYKDINTKIEFSWTERKELNFRQEEVTKDHFSTVRDLKWNKPKSIEFSNSEKEFFKWVLSKMDSEKKLTADHIWLYNLFVK